jgi:hypothetical protein
MTSKKASEKKRKRGRPKTGGRAPIRPIRFHDDDWKLIGRAAKKAGKPTGTYVRETTLGTARNDLGMPQPDKNA